MSEYKNIENYTDFIESIEQDLKEINSIYDYNIINFLNKVYIFIIA